MPWFQLLSKYPFLEVADNIVQGHIETTNVFPWDQDIGESQLMTWRQIQELNQSGLVKFGSHTQNHHVLDTLDEKNADYELRNSKQIIEKKLGKEIRHFAYPRGIFTKTYECSVRELYHTGVLIFDGETLTNSLSTDSLTKLKRIPVQRSDGYLLFAARIKGWLVMEEFLKNFFQNINDKIHTKK